MIALIKKDEIIDIIKQLETIEEAFWLKYRYYNEHNRTFLEEQFDSINDKLMDLINEDGKQVETEIKNENE